jgi:RNA polymerase sigma-70 factor (ECF subfamily)
VEGEREATWPQLGLARAGVPVTARHDVFAALMVRQLDAAYRLAAVILGDANEAEDAAHDAALAAWRSRDLLHEEARFEAWFTRIIVNVCRDRLRSRARGRVVEIDVDPIAAADASARRVPDQGAEFATRDALGRALRVLEADELIVVVLRFYRDLAIDDIADRLAIPPGTVKSRLHHALRRLRAAVEAGEVA